MFPEKRKKGEFIALLDFERPFYMKERLIQLQALEETNTKYIVLNGHYSIQEIRQIYRKCSIYFLASHESFGLPICELQACGSYIFTPYLYWPIAHLIKENQHISETGKLSPNFIVYDNDKTKLTEEMIKIKNFYDPQRVVDTFKSYDPHYFTGI